MTKSKYEIILNKYKEDYNRVYENYISRGFKQIEEEIKFLSQILAENVIVSHKQYIVHRTVFLNWEYSLEIIYFFK